jgi:hypothetical protein
MIDTLEKKMLVKDVMEKFIRYTTNFNEKIYRFMIQNMEMIENQHVINFSD